MVCLINSDLGAWYIPVLLGLEPSMMRVLKFTKLSGRLKIIFQTAFNLYRSLCHVYERQAANRHQKL